MSELAGDLRRNYGPYEVESVLGRGAMGMVYLARDRRIGRKVALKTVHVEERFDDESEAKEFYKRLQREAELCGALQHPNIVTLYEPGYDNETITWLATEYVDGESLRDRMKKRKPMPLVEALRITDGILRGLAFAHSKGIIHRDIKPANILLTAAGEAKIADFGIARPVDSNLTAAGEMLGTPSYMSPEQVKCTAVTAKSDLFSVGAVLYEMVTGVKAFAASDVSGILRNVCELEPRPAHEAHGQVPPPLSSVIKRLLAKNPNDRFEDAAAALLEIDAILNEIAPETMADAAPPAAVSTISAAKRRPGPPTQPSITSVSHGDATPAVGRRGPSWRRWDRQISTPLFFGVIAALILVLGGTATAILLQTDDNPTITFTPEELQHFADKREQLRYARELYSSGQYPQALEAYDAYLVRHPASIVAREERGETIMAMEAKVKSASDVTVKPPRNKAPAKKADEPKKGFWRRIFGRD